MFVLFVQFSLSFYICQAPVAVTPNPVCLAHIISIMTLQEYFSMPIYPCKTVNKDFSIRLTVQTEMSHHSFTVDVREYSI